jgi:hypothetical protein
MIDVDLKLMDLCSKHYWFVSNAIFKTWTKSYLILDSIEVSKDEILLITETDTDYGPVFRNHQVIIVETEEEADRLLKELNKKD